MRFAVPPGQSLRRTHGATLAGDGAERAGNEGAAGTARAGMGTEEHPHLSLIVAVIIHLCCEVVWFWFVCNGKTSPKKR